MGTRGLDALGNLSEATGLFNIAKNNTQYAKKARQSKITRLTSTSRI